MTAPTNTFITTSVIGNREDLSDVIYRISPTTTPLLSGAAKTTATNTLHEWQTQDLAAAASNLAVEGDDATLIAATPTVRLTNRCQISTKPFGVSGTQQAMNPAGRKNELSYQGSLKSLELKRDMEFAMTQQSVLATSPRATRGLVGWVVDNTSKASDTTLASYTANTDKTDGTTRAFVESQVKSVCQLVYTAGGDPDTIMMGPAAKQTFSSFTGNATRMDKSEDAKLYTSIDVYVSDFGELKAVPNRFQRTRDVFILQMDKLAVAYLRPFQTIELAKTGDSDRRELVVEFALECRAPKAHGAVYDIA
jgi:hypothetical protein